MPLPTPRTRETQQDFVSRCMGNDTLVDEYPDQEQRAGICYSQWRRRPRAQTDAVDGKGEYSTHRVTANNYTSRVEVHQGRHHLVVPVVMMVEGVHHGSHGPLLHPASELGRFPASWNGIPVCVQHPEQGSANTPGVIDTQTVGRVYHARMDGPKLRAEVWVDEPAIQRVSPEAYLHLTRGKPLEVSVGVFTDDEPTTGDWNGEHYTAVARNHRPDHLALLPGGEGACSWADGCGVRANTKGDGDVTKPSNISAVLTMAKGLVDEGYGLALNELGHGELAQTIQSKLDRMDDDAKMHFLEECFNDYFIFSARPRDGGEVAMPPDGSTLFKRGYQVDESGTVEFIGESVPVTKKVEYVPIPTGTQTNSKKGDKTMAKDKTTTTPCCPEKVELLIQSDHSTFAEGDREWLSVQDEAFIDRMLAMQKDAEDLKGKVQTLETAAKATADESKGTTTTTITEAQAIKVLESKLSDPDKFLALLPKPVREYVQDGLSLAEQHRTDLITRVSEYSDVYSAEELAAMDTPALRKLAAYVKVPSDYSARAGITDATSKVEPLIPLQI